MIAKLLFSSVIALSALVLPLQSVSAATAQGYMYASFSRNGDTVENGIVVLNARTNKALKAHFEAQALKRTVSKPVVFVEVRGVKVKQITMKIGEPSKQRNCKPTKVLAYRYECKIGPVKNGFKNARKVEVDVVPETHGAAKVTFGSYRVKANGNKQISRTAPVQLTVLPEGTPLP